MENIFIIVVLLCFLIILFLQILILRRGSNSYLHDLKSKLNTYEKELDKFFFFIKDEFTRNRDELNKRFNDLKEELLKFINAFINQFEIKSKNIDDKLSYFNELQRKIFNELFKKQEELSNKIDEKLEKIRNTVEDKLKAIQEDNNIKLEKMRETVDEKLSKTLESRLGESFRLVSERLEQVHKGLGEMQNLATGVGDLKKVLTNIKSKGILGEFQLENILEQILTPDQYLKNVKTKKESNANVEFAIKLPGKKEEKTVLLPIDSKFPTEDYHALLDAYDQGNSILIEEYKIKLSKTIETCAKEIKEKYINPPDTTDFALMFLPFEGLYAEVLRITGLFEKIQREYRVIVTGPTTISAFLNSLQMGFRTLAIEKRTSEVWELLGSIKTEFATFGTILEKTKKKMTEATNVIDQATKRSKMIEKKLKNVHSLPDESYKKSLLE